MFFLSISTAFLWIAPGLDTTMSLDEQKFLYVCLLCKLENLSNLIQEKCSTYKLCGICQYFIVVYIYCGICVHNYAYGRQKWCPIMLALWNFEIKTICSAPACKSIFCIILYQFISSSLSFVKKKLYVWLVFMIFNNSPQFATICIVNKK